MTMFGNMRAVQLMHVGDIAETWCSTCGHQTNHVYGWWPAGARGHWLTCLQCNPEAMEMVKQDG